MTRNTKKSLVELIGATYGDALDEFCKNFDLPPTLAATIPITMRKDRIAQIALQIAFDAGLYYGKTHPDKVAINLPLRPQPPVSLNERRTLYVG